MGRQHGVRAVAAVLALWSVAFASAALAQAVPVITSPPPGPGVVGTTYGHQFTSTSVTPAPTYSVTAGTLPPGLTLGESGLLLGNPTQAGSFGPTTVCASNGVAPPACQTFTITVGRAMCGPGQRVARRDGGHDRP